MSAFYIVPGHFYKIVERLVQRDWIVHGFTESEKAETYNFATYVYNKRENGVKYSLHLDLNIYQFILNAFKKAKPKREHRDAMALLAFCQLAEIEIDPTFAVYEKINYRKDNHVLDEATKDLELFHRINNSDDSSIIDFALGRVDSISILDSYPIDHNYIKESLIKYNRLIEWDSLYVIVLYIIYVSELTGLDRLGKVKKVVEWMITDFRLSLVCITFAAIYFGEKPMKKMMKYKIAQSSEERGKSAFNMTWDLYNLNRYFRLWTDRSPEEEGLFASSDKVFNSVLRESIKVQHLGGLDGFARFMPKELVLYLDEITNKPNQYAERVSNTAEWSPAYRDELIRNFEFKIGIA